MRDGKYVNWGLNIKQTLVAIHFNFFGGADTPQLFIRNGVSMSTGLLAFWLA